MEQVRATAIQCGRSGLPTLITGESGVGKELVAGLVHAAADRTGPLVAVNCATLPASMAESELFGHVRGAFTGAATAYRGAFQRADNGTLFLDEIGELPLEQQPKLLRLLETMRVRPLGSQCTHVVDVRVVAATHRDLGAMAAQGTFRQDLLYRLDVLRVHVPPLRARPSDLDLLVPALLRRVGLAAVVDGDAMAVLREHGWPGNVRELRNVLVRASRLSCDGVLARDDVVRALRPRGMWHVPPAVGPTQAESDPTGADVADPDQGTGAGGGAKAPPERSPTYQPMRDYCSRATRVLARNGGDVTATYRELGVPRSTFYRWLRQGWVRRPALHRRAAVGGPMRRARSGRSRPWTLEFAGARRADLDPAIDVGAGGRPGDAAAEAKEGAIV